MNDSHVELCTDEPQGLGEVRRSLNAAGPERLENAATECVGTTVRSTGGHHRRVTLPADLGGESPCFAHLLDDPFA